MAKTRETRKEEDRERKTREIMDATLGLFSKKGYGGTTLEDIAQELGYAKASLYYYFPNKESIVRTMIKEAMCEASGRMAEIMKASTDPVTNLEHLITYYVEDYSDSRGFFNIYHQVVPFMDQILSPEESELMKTEMKVMSEHIISMIKRGIAAGEFIDEDPQLLGEMTLGMLSGLMAQIGHGFVKTWDPKNLVKTITRIIVNSIRK